MSGLETLFRGIPDGAGSGADTLLQRVPTARAPMLRPLYWRSFRRADDGVGPVAATLEEDGRIAIAAGTTVSFDTYFGGFFEWFWWARTRLASAELRVLVAGDCRIRVLRRIGEACHVLREIPSRGSGEAVEHRVRLVDESVNFRQCGMIYFEVSADGGAPARLVRAEWHSDAAEPAVPASLAVVICSHNRETWLARILDAACSDPVAAASFDRVIVVNQGEAGLAGRDPFRRSAAALRDRLTVVEQRNLGGAGGFTRGIMEALDDPGLTHVLLLDDDIDLEPETLVRMRAFLGHASANVAVGGHMLDRVQPLRLYEAGGAIDEATWFVRAVMPDLDIAKPRELARLAGPAGVHYNGWWCFGMPLAAVREVGLPLPCFIRGDDAEYGVRLGRAGYATVPVPGIAVWHEPFYLKLGGWHLYYETRNLLVLAALHRDFSARAACRRQVRHLLLHLLTYRYAGVALILRAIEDFLIGPAVFRAEPSALHREIVALAARDAPERIGRDEVIEEGRPASVPRRRAAFVAWFAFVLLRNALVRGGGTDRRVPVDGFSWITLRRLDRAVLDNWWEERMPAYRRSRARFLALGWEAARVLLRLARAGGRAGAAWREAVPGLCTMEAWRALAEPAGRRGDGIGTETSWTEGRETARGEVVDLDVE